MKSLSAIILAAGKGKRLGGTAPKVAREVFGKPMVRWVVDACVEAGCGRVVIVVGHGREEVESIFEGYDSGGTTIEFAAQDEQLGTGHAVQCAEGFFSKEKSEGGHAVLVLAGDGPLIRASTLRALADRHVVTDASATLATSVIDDPKGYGRIVRDEKGRFKAIVEEKNATDEQRAIREVNPSYYCFDVRSLFEALKAVRRDPVGGEFYLTDVPALMLAGGRRVEVIDAVPAADVLSINTPEQLMEVDELLRVRAESRATPNAGAGR